jgi:hypothetical protein
VIRRLCEEARGVGARVMTLGEYAAWWNVRLGIRPTVTCGGGSLVSKCEGPSPAPGDLDVLLEISRRPGEKALIALGSSVALDKLSWRSVPLFSAPSDIRRMREFDLRGEIGRQFTRLQRRFP